MIKLDVEMKPGAGCMECPLRTWVYDGDEPYDICGVSGKDIPYDINADNPEKRMDGCKIID